MDPVRSNDVQHHALRSRLTRDAVSARTILVSPPHPHERVDRRELERPTGSVRQGLSLPLRARPRPCPRGPASGSLDPKTAGSRCADFLQKPTPKDIPYPHLNDGNGVVKLHAFLYWIRLAKAVGRIGGTLGAILVAFWAVSWYLL